MQYAVLMTESCPFEELKHEASDCGRIESTSLAVCVHVPLEILVAELKDENQFRFRMDNIVQSDDVDMLKLFHKRDLTNSGRRRALLCIQMDFLQSHNLIGCP